ncbi:MAG: response regulator, partial [Oscillospiraceae bacterium]
MENKIKILVGDDSAENGVMIANFLRSEGFSAVTRQKDGLAIFETIKTEMPDIVIVDSVLPHLDAIELIKKVNSSVYKKPKFIVS